MGFTQIVKGLGGLISKNSPTILTVLGVGGFVGTVVLSIKATPVAIQLLDAERERRSRLVDEETDILNITKIEIVGLTWKQYLPVVVLGGVSIACVIGAHAISLKRLAVLGTAYGVLAGDLKQYKAKVGELFGRVKEEEVRTGVATDKIMAAPPREGEIIQTGRGNVLFYDPWSSRYFRSDIERIRRSINDLNYQLMNDVTISQNEFYTELGLRETKAGNIMGWDINKDGQIQVSFEPTVSEECDLCFMLDYTVYPRY